MTEHLSTEHISAKEWYAFFDGKVHGPLSSDIISTMPQYGKDGLEMLISQKGFKKWHSLDKLEALSETKEQERIKDNIIPDKTSKPRKVEKKNLLSTKRKNENSFASMLADQTINQLTRVSEDKNKSPLIEKSSQNNNGTPQEETSEIYEPWAFNPNNPLPGLSNLKINDPNEKANQIKSHPKKSEMLKSNYYLLKGRLRLGNLEHPLRAAFLWGLIWHKWAVSRKNELEWHVHGCCSNKTILFRLSWIPLLHLFAGWQIAKLISSAEQQNGYQLIKQKVAMFLWIIPPLGILYMQKYINYHWDLHVLNIVSRDDER